MLATGIAMVIGSRWAGPLVGIYAAYVAVNLVTWTITNPGEIERVGRRLSSASDPASLWWIGAAGFFGYCVVALATTAGPAWLLRRRRNTCSQSPQTGDRCRTPMRRNHRMRAALPRGLSRHPGGNHRPCCARGRARGPGNHAAADDGILPRRRRRLDGATQLRPRAACAPRPAARRAAVGHSEEGRNSRLGQSLDCIRCDAFEMPSDFAAYKRTAIFTTDSVPTALRKDHSTAVGVWATDRRPRGAGCGIASTRWRPMSSCRPSGRGSSCPRCAITSSRSGPRDSSSSSTAPRPERRGDIDRRAAHHPATLPRRPRHRSRGYSSIRHAVAWIRYAIAPIRLTATSSRSRTRR